MKSATLFLQTVRRQTALLSRVLFTRILFARVLAIGLSAGVLVDPTFAQTASTYSPGGPPPPGVLFLERTPGVAQVSIAFLPDDVDALPDALPDPGSAPSQLAVTGAYSSGDRFAPEGFVIRQGDATHPWPQGWDGLLLVGAGGGASLHDVASVAYGGERFNLRDRDERAAFLALASADGLSAIQSHLLIRDGALDLVPVENAPQFRRRMLFQLKDGRIGVFDTSPRSVSLYEAAAQLLDAVEPIMAINLDMGAYDFCERIDRGIAESCGLLSRDRMDKLTNVILFSQP